ncbi:MAG: TetR/AcrR family transcriptional regulator [Bacteroidaceae bacterium]|nr:TetR/AcrR family transcriptional regulator [Bacteroidaceae bacterium]
MEQNIEKKIIEAAKRAFLKKGYSDTNMAEIAEEVGLTRPAMHYYFRTKERLFKAALGELIHILLPKLRGYITSDATLREKVTNIVSTYTELLKETPEIPLFIIKEINRDVNNMLSIASDTFIIESAGMLKAAIQQEIAAGHIKNVPIMDIVYTMYGLMAFPVLARPLGNAIFDTDITNEEFRQRWKNNIIEQMVHMLTPEEKE